MPECYTGRHPAFKHTEGPCWRTPTQEFKVHGEYSAGWVAICQHHADDVLDRLLRINEILGQAGLPTYGLFSFRSLVD